MLSRADFDEYNLMSEVPETEPQFWPQPVIDDDDETQPPSQPILDTSPPTVVVSDPVVVVSDPAVLDVVVSNPSPPEVPDTNVLKRYKWLAPDTYDGYEGVNLSEYEEEEVQSAPPKERKFDPRVSDILQLYLGDLYNPNDYNSASSSAGSAPSSAWYACLAPVARHGSVEVPPISGVFAPVFTPATVE